MVELIIVVLYCFVFCICGGFRGQVMNSDRRCYLLLIEVVVGIRVIYIPWLGNGYNRPY
jgi:Na+/pantothenate symporter